MVVAKVWKQKNDFKGTPTLNDFELVDEKLSDSLKENEILIEAVYFTVDPYIRLFKLDSGLPAEQVGRVLDSKASKFPKGTLVLAHVGWRSHAIVDVTKPMHLGFMVEVVPEITGLSPSLWLGILGMPGITAYLAFLEKTKPQKGEVVVVSAASGAVGSVVGQLAVNKGCTVIGFAGSEKKINWLKELGFHHVFNYKQTTVSEALDKAAPDGVDIYYDNVGGDFTDNIMSRLRKGGRSLVCGQIADYNREANKVRNPYVDILTKELTVIGYLIFSHIEDFSRARKDMIPLVKEGKLKPKEHVTTGFENMPKAFLELFSGANFGKAIIKC